MPISIFLRQWLYLPTLYLSHLIFNLSVDYYDLFNECLHKIKVIISQLLNAILKSCRIFPQINFNNSAKVCPQQNQEMFCISNTTSSSKSNIKNELAKEHMKILENLGMCSMEVRH